MSFFAISGFGINLDLINIFYFSEIKKLVQVAQKVFMNHEQKMGKKVMDLQEFHHLSNMNLSSKP